MKHFYSLLLILFFAPSYLKAQSNYKPGYIVTLKGDTSKGFVDYKEWNKNPQRISFKTSETAGAQQLSTADVNAFGITGFDDYQKHVLPISMSAVKTIDLPSALDTSFVVAPVFLRIVAAGKKVTLYQYIDDLKERFFIAERSNTPVELKRNLYRDAVNGSVAREVNTYRLQLQRLSTIYQPGNQALLYKIQGAVYQQGELEKIVIAINGVDGFTTKVNHDRGGMRFFAGIAANATRTKVTGQSSFSTVDPNTSILPQISFGADFFINKNIGKWLFRAEITVMANNVDLLYHGVIVDNVNVYKYDEQFKFYQFGAVFNPQFVYNFFNKDDFKAYIAAGAAFSVCSYSNAEHVITNSSGQKTYEPVMPRSLNSIYYYGTAKAGITLRNKFEIYAGYSTPTSVTNAFAYSVKISQYKLGVNYLFGKK